MSHECSPLFLRVLDRRQGLSVSESVRTALFEGLENVHLVCWRKKPSRECIDHLIVVRRLTELQRSHICRYRPTVSRVSHLMLIALHGADTIRHDMVDITECALTLSFGLCCNVLCLREQKPSIFPARGAVLNTVLQPDGIDILKSRVLENL